MLLHQTPPCHLLRQCLEDVVADGEEVIISLLPAEVPLVDPVAEVVSRVVTRASL